MEDRPKDPMTKFRSVTLGKNSKGGDRTQLYLDKAEALALHTTLGTLLDNENGVKLDLHVSDKVAQETQHKFKSAIMFVKATGERPTQGPGAQRTLVPKGQSAATRSRVEKAKSGF